MIRVAGLELLVARVIWKRGPEVGVRFDAPLHSSVVTFLAKENPAPLALSEEQTPDSALG